MKIYKYRNTIEQKQFLFEKLGENFCTIDKNKLFIIKDKRKIIGVFEIRESIVTPIFMPVLCAGELVTFIRENYSNMILCLNNASMFTRKVYNDFCLRVIRVTNTVAYFEI